MSIPRKQRMAMWLGLCIGAAAYLGYRLGSGPALLPEPKHPAPFVEEHTQGDAISNNLTRLLADHPFAFEPEDSAAETKPPSNSEASAIQAIRLRGILRVSGKSWVLLSGPDGKIQRLGAGQSWSGISVTEIKPRTVVLTGNGATREVKLFEPAGKP